MSKYSWLWVVVAVLVLIAAWQLWPNRSQAAETRLEALAGPAENGFQRALSPRSFSFPLDFGPHTDFQTEWWYYTGNLSTPDGRAFGYQLTFFRRAIEPAQGRPTRSSEWASDQVYFAHFTLTDVSGNAFHYFERFERGAAGLAGASGQPLYQAWLRDWSVKQLDEHRYQLSAAAEDIQISLELVDTKGPVLQGEQGLSQKGAQPGNASYYVSQTRLESRGSIQVGGQTYAVSGLSWMDHEFSTSSLSADQVGWDWFALQLSDGSELMVYRMRRADGSLDPFSQGTIIYPDGRTRFLKNDEVRIQVLSTWKSPHSGASYPAEWTVDVPSEQISLRVTPRLADQELRVSFTYWEGAVMIRGSRTGKEVGGSGYVELTGYARSMQGQF